MKAYYKDGKKLCINFKTKDCDEVVTIEKADDPSENSNCEYILTDEDGETCPYTREEIMDDFGIDILDWIK